MPRNDSGKDNGAAAIVVLGHGSRAPGAAGLLARVAAGLSERTGCTALAASLQFNQPTLADCCHKLAAAGFRRIIIAPYFLYEGNHMQRDIPAQLASLRAELAEVELVLAKPLGIDGQLMEVMIKRILAAGSWTADKAKSVNQWRETLNVKRETIETKTLRASNVALGEEIEKESFTIIDAILGIDDNEDPEYQVVRRVIHASGDPSLAAALVFSRGAVAAAAEAFALGSPIICDVNMTAAGITPSAAGTGLTVACAVAEAEAADLAGAAGISRCAAGIRLLAGRFGLGGAVAVIGNAPTALLEVLRLEREAGLRPALVIGVPVGFVGAAESKQALAGTDIPHITLPGNRGGSNIAAAIVNALLRLGAAR